MKNKIKKLLFRFSVTALLIFGLLLIIVLNPLLTYGNKYKHNNYRIFYSQPVDHILDTRLDQATQLVSTSEYFDKEFKLDICLNDGSDYPKIIQIFHGRAFAMGFYNKVVLLSNVNVAGNYAELNGYKWNLTQLLAHEMMHCYLFNRRGFWKSKPFAKIPNWKWEGYPEYIARNSTELKDLKENISHLLGTEKTDNNGWILFNDGTGTSIIYYKYWLLVKYCMDIKKMDYDQILEDESSEQQIWAQMMNWYNKK